MDFCIYSNEGSVAGLEWNTWDEVCALDFQNASGVCSDNDSQVLTVCYDCLCLISLFRTVMSLSYDWDEVFVWTGHDEGYLPWRLYSPLVVDRVTEYLFMRAEHFTGWLISAEQSLHIPHRMCTCTKLSCLRTYNLYKHNIFCWEYKILATGTKPSICIYN